MKHERVAEDGVTRVSREIHDAERHALYLGLALDESLDPLALIAHPASQSYKPGVPTVDVLTLPAVVPFAVANAGEIRVSVYNVTGQEVAVLASGVHEAGFHQVRWNGRDLSGRSVSSGVYLVRMVADGFSAVRKVLLLK